MICALLFYTGEGHGDLLDIITGKNMPSFTAYYVIIFFISAEESQISVSVSVTETARGRFPYEPHNNIGSDYQNNNG